MKLLALDSATEACSVALHLDGVVHERFELAPRLHTQLLLPMAHGLLAEAGIGLRDIDLLAYAHGPGSFTGLRISAGVVQGLALGLDCPVIGVSTLAALAARTMRLHGSHMVATAMDARMGQVYWGEYGLDSAGNAIALSPDCLLDPGHVPRLDATQWQVAGTGWQRYPDALTDASGLPTSMAGIELYPHAEDVAQLAMVSARQGGGMPALSVQPVYLRQEVAKKHNKNRV